jgi:hypothetical protein
VRGLASGRHGTVRVEPLGTVTGAGESELPLGTELLDVWGTPGCRTVPGGTGFIVESLGMGRFEAPGIDVVGPMPSPGAGPLGATGVPTVPGGLLMADGFTPGALTPVPGDAAGALEAAPCANAVPGRIVAATRIQILHFITGLLRR